MCAWWSGGVESAKEIRSRFRRRGRVDLGYTLRLTATRETTIRKKLPVFTQTPALDLSCVLRPIQTTEIEEARSIQQSLLPAEPLRSPAFEVACKVRTASAVGGDFLDYFWLANQTLGLYLGDVVGKGLSAAFYAALSAGILRGIAKTDNEPTFVLERLNDRLLDRLVCGRYCVVQYALYTPTTRELRFANAGLMPRPLHISRQGCHELGHGGFPCGMFQNAHYDLYKARLEPGDTVFFATDSLIDAQDASGRQFGIEGLRKACEASAGKSVLTMLEDVFRTLDTFTLGARQYDDMTAAALRVL